MYQILQYIKFLLRSSNEHGVHSPFVFELVTKCFYDKKRYSEYQKIREYKEKLYQNNQVIEVTDFGAGSRVFKSNKRKISKIARTAGITKRRARLLFRICRYLNVKNTLELGTSLGIATAALASHKTNSVTSIEGCPETSGVAKNSLRSSGFDNIQIKTGEFSSILPDQTNQQYDLVYFDGNHSKEATLHYFNLLISSKHNNTLFLFDDIHWSREMNEAWETIKTNEEVSITIDTFYQGLVFFRKEHLEKEHFTMRL